MHNPNATEMEVADALHELEKNPHRQGVEHLYNWVEFLDLWRRGNVSDERMFIKAKAVLSVCRVVGRDKNVL